MREGEYSVGAKALYQEDGARMVVTVLANNSDPEHLRYKLRVLGPVRDGFFPVAPGAGDGSRVFPKDTSGVVVQALPTGTEFNVSKRSSEAGTLTVWRLSELSDLVH